MESKWFVFYFYLFFFIFFFFHNYSYFFICLFLEDKFAVASGAKLVSICYFEKDNDWWVSKHIRKHDSTVFKVDWHPNNVLLATASADNNARVVSAFIRGVDKKPGDTAYGARLPFGELFATYPARGWMHAVKWSPSGDYIAFCSMYFFFIFFFCIFKF